MGTCCLGGVDGRTGLGRLFLLENDESKLLGDIVSGDMVDDIGDMNCC